MSSNKQTAQAKMRQTMALFEARTPKATPKKTLSHAELVAQEQARRAQELVKIKQQIDELKAKALKVATEAKSHIWELHAWEQDWVNDLRKSVAAVRKRYQAAAQEELEYQREDNPNAVLDQINLYDCASEGLAAWWDDKKDRLDWGDAQYRWNDYMDAHPRTEMSDDMSRLRAEDEMLRKIQHLNGGFGSVAEMDQTLSLISDYCYTLQYYSDNGWSGVGSTALDIVQKGIPVILFFCKLVTAIPA
jgi:hypothetical protein